MNTNYWTVCFCNAKVDGEDNIRCRCLAPTTGPGTRACPACRSGRHVDTTGVRRAARKREHVAAAVS